jgi:hypothetical protein
VGVGVALGFDPIQVVIATKGFKVIIVANKNFMAITIVANKGFRTTIAKQEH